MRYANIRAHRIMRCARAGRSRAAKNAWQKPEFRTDVAMKTDVLVVGGGLAGATTALFLADEGVAVTLIEEGVVGGKASGANAGSVHLQIPYAEYKELGEGWAAGFATLLPMLLESVALWQRLAERLGPDCAVSLGGGLLVATTPAQMALIEAKTALERARGVPTEVIGKAELATIAPYVAPDTIGAAWCPMEGKGNPLKACPAIAAAARAAGVTIKERCTLLSLERDGAHWRAKTSAGDILATRVVNAAGAAAAKVARMVGLDIAVEGVPIQATVTEAAAPLVPHLVYSAATRLTLKQMANGTFVIGGGWPSRLSRAGRLTVNPHSLAANMGTAARTVPAVGRLRAARSWPAIVNGTADWLPLIGEAPRQKGFYLALFPWIGFTAAPITARIVADLVLGRPAPVDRALLIAG